MDPALLVAISGVVATFLTAVAGVLNNWLNTKPTIQSLRAEVASLRALMVEDRRKHLEEVTSFKAEVLEMRNKHKDCEAHREKMQQLLLEIMQDKLKPPQPPGVF